TGNASLPKLTFEQLELEDVKVRIVYRDGLLTLEELSAKMRDLAVATGPTGSFRGTATLGVEPAGDLNAKLTLERVPLAQVRRLAPTSPDARGSVSGSVELRVPNGTFGDLSKWTAAGAVKAEGLGVAGVGLGALAFNPSVGDGQLRLRDITSA